MYHCWKNLLSYLVVSQSVIFQNVVDFILEVMCQFHGVLQFNLEVVMNSPDTESIIPWEVYELKQQNLRDNKMWYWQGMGGREGIKFQHISTHTYINKSVRIIWKDFFLYFFFFIINWKIIKLVTAQIR